MSCRIFDLSENPPRSNLKFLRLLNDFKASARDDPNSCVKLQPLKSISRVLTEVFPSLCNDFMICCIASFEITDVIKFNSIKFGKDSWLLTIYPKNDFDYSVDKELSFEFKMRTFNYFIVNSPYNIQYWVPLAISDKS